MPSNIPAARGIVKGVAKRIEGVDPEAAALLMSTIPMMQREKPKRRVTGRHANCSDKVAKRIREYALAHQDRSFAEIALVFDVNPGRVSEALRDLR